MSREQQRIGVTWFIVHCALFSVMSAISKILLDTISVFELLFFQTLLGSLFMLPFILTRHLHELKIPSYRIHIARAFFWVLASSLFFYSITVISIPKAIAISFAVPLFTTIMAIVFLKESIHIHRTLSLISGFVGMIIIIQPGLEAFEKVSLLVVFASFLWSMTDIIIKLVGQAHNALVNTFFFSVFSLVFTIPMAILFWKTPNIVEMAWLVLLAFIFVINIVTVTKAYENADLTIIMPFSFSQLIFVAILSYVIFGEIINSATAIGSVVIICSTSYIAYRERKAHGKFLAPDIAEEIYDVDIEDISAE